MLTIKDYIAIAVSVAALVISATTFYFTKLYDPGISFEISPRLEWITNDDGRETFILPITFLNSGARGYAVTQIVLQIKNGRSGSARRYIASQFAVRRSNPFEFAPETLTGGSSVARSYLFERFETGKNTIRDIGAPPTSPADFALRTAGQYRGTVLVRLNGSSVFTVAKEFTFRIKDDEVERLREKPYKTQLVLDLETFGS